MTTLLDDLAIFNNYDTVGIHNGRKPVTERRVVRGVDAVALAENLRYNECGTSLTELRERALNLLFSLRINSAGSLV